MRYCSVTQIKEPGYYWWLPSDSIVNSDKKEYWKIVLYPLLDESRLKSGIVFGPLESPVIDLSFLKHELKKEEY